MTNPNARHCTALAPSVTYRDDPRCGMVIAVPDRDKCYRHYGFDMGRQKGQACRNCAGGYRSKRYPIYVICIEKGEVFSRSEWCVDCHEKGVG